VPNYTRSLQPLQINTIPIDRCKDRTLVFRLMYNSLAFNQAYLTELTVEVDQNSKKKPNYLSKIFIVFKQNISM
jgi:hypothetical protein